MTGKELLEAYPKAAEIVVKYYSEQFIKSIEAGDVSDEIKEYAKGQTIDVEYIATFMDINPRGLFDVFDSHEVYIQITVDLENNCFRYSFDGGQLESNDYLTRIAAETRSIEAAFEILNNKL
jgi:hypothetical protein